MATFEDLSIDDSLDLLSRVQQYGTSNIALQRLVHVSKIHSFFLSFQKGEEISRLTPPPPLLSSPPPFPPQTGQNAHGSR